MRGLLWCVSGRACYELTRHAYEPHLIGGADVSISGYRLRR